jgi:N-acetylneuraminate lyase
MNKCKLAGLVAAVHTPFHPDGSLNLAAVERQAGQLLRHRLAAVFVCGSTGESQSLSCDERRQLARRWVEVCRGTPMRVVVHVGSNCLPEAKALAREAAELGVAAISAVAPFYFKPRTLQGLVEWCAAIASAAPSTPFYFYDVPVLTNVHFPMPAFLAQAADRIPTLNGIKFTNNDLMAFQLCLQADDGAFDIPWGIDECMLAAFALGGTGAVGSTYNFAAPVFQALLAALARGDLATAREQQQRATALIQLMFGYGYLGASKVIMKWLGADVGPCRPPLDNLNVEQAAKLRRELEAAGFFDWAQPVSAAPPGPKVRAARASDVS